MKNNKDLKKIIKLVKRSEKIVLFHHINPDGDTLSSSYGLMKALQKRFPNKKIKWFADKKNIQKNFGFLFNDFEDSINKVDSSWTAIIGDNAVLERIYGKEHFMNAGVKICFDHHQNSINFKADAYWSQPDLGASSVQAYWIAKALKTNFDNNIALTMIFGILTDTYNFTYSLNDTRPIIAAQDLMEHIDKKSMDNMYKDMRRRTKQDIEFQSFVLSNFKIQSNIAFLKITDEDQKKLKLTPQQAKRVNLIGNIEGVYVWAFLIEDKKDNVIKISLRSNGFKVNKVANEFGGGGHNRAAGVVISQGWKQVNKVMDYTKKELRKFLNEK